MKRVYFILIALCICMFTFAQSTKVETFDKNTWHWTEGASQFQSIAIEDGFLVIKNLKKNKKATPYQNMAKSYAKLPLRPQESFKLTIRYLVADYNLTYYQILFNTGKQCLEDDAVGFESYIYTQLGPFYMLAIGNVKNQLIKLPKVKAKGEYPMEFVLQKRGKNVTIEINGMPIYEGELKITNSCIGFNVSLFNKKTSYIKIDEVIVEQADPDDD